MCLAQGGAQGRNTVMPVRLKPAAFWGGNKHDISFESSATWNFKFNLKKSSATISDQVNSLPSSVIRSADNFWATSLEPGQARQNVWA